MTEQDRIDALDASDHAECLTCGKQFHTMPRVVKGPLRGGSIGLAHQNMTDHDVRPVAREGEGR